MATPLQEARVDTKKPHTKDKSPNHHKTTDEETCLLYSLCVKHLSPEGWKRQHRSQLSAVPCAPFHRLGCVFCINKRMDVPPSLGGPQTAVLLVPMCSRANSTKSSMRTGHAPWRKETKMTDVSCIKFNQLFLKGSTTDIGLSKKKLLINSGGCWERQQVGWLHIIPFTTDSIVMHLT